MSEGYTTIKFAESNLQTFPPSPTQGKIYGGSNPPRDANDVVERLKESLFPLRGTFTEKTADKPDLYGPFWICTTLIFVAASTGTFVTYIAHKWKNQEWNYDINMVTWSAGVFYGYVTLVPLAVYVILKCFSAPSGLVQLFCLYGYSLFIFIPTLCLSVVPLEIHFFVCSRKIQFSLTILLLGVGIATVTDLQLNMLGSILMCY